MKCLLCDDDGAELMRDGEQWLGCCLRCGTYAFDSAFAELVKHAHANHDAAVLRELSRLGSVVRRTADRCVIRRDNFVELLEQAK